MPCICLLIGALPFGRPGFGPGFSFMTQFRQVANQSSFVACCPVLAVQKLRN